LCKSGQSDTGSGQNGLCGGDTSRIKPGGSESYKSSAGNGAIGLAGSNKPVNGHQLDGGLDNNPAEKRVPSFTDGKPLQGGGVGYPNLMNQADNNELATNSSVKTDNKTLLMQMQLIDEPKAKDITREAFELLRKSEDTVSITGQLLSAYSIQLYTWPQFRTYAV
jgi:hypothetical protein